MAQAGRVPSLRGLGLISCGTQIMADTPKYANLIQPQKQRAAQRGSSVTSSRSEGKRESTEIEWGWGWGEMIARWSLLEEA